MVPPCKPCSTGKHVECFQVLSDHPDDECGCYNEDPNKHETKEAYFFASTGQYYSEEED